MNCFIFSDKLLTLVFFVNVEICERLCLGAAARASLQNTHHRPASALETPETGRRRESCEEVPPTMGERHYFYSVTSTTMFSCSLNRKPAVAPVAQWIECWSVNQWVAGLIPSQGTCLGCWPDS